MANNYNNREEIPNEYKWDLSFILDINKLDEYIKKIEELICKVASYENHILDNSDNLLNFFLSSKELDLLSSRLYLYAHLDCDTNTKDSQKQALKMQVMNIFEKMTNKLSFVTPELLSKDLSEVKRLLAEKEELNKYDFYFEKLYREKNHILSKKEEKLLSLTSPLLRGAKNIYYNLCNADSIFGQIKNENGEKIKITESNYVNLMGAKDRNTRKKVFNEYYKFYQNHKNTLGNIYAQKIKEDFFVSKVRKYKSPLEMSLYDDNIDISLYDHLINQVHNYLPLLYRYLECRRKACNLDKLHMFDIYYNPVMDNDKIYTFEEAKDIVKEALKPLGDEYQAKLSKQFKNRWTDVYPSEGKKSGAYQWSYYGVPSYVLLNHTNDLKSVETLAHEYGHAMHTAFSCEYQDYIYHDYPIFLAEIASTVNEVLLFEYMYSKTDDKDIKKAMILDLLDKYRTTIFRQTMFAEFEKIAHDKEEKGIPLTEEELSNTYYELNKLYFGKDVVSDKQIRYEWMRIPHFYTPFYVYKYATGLISAVSIATAIINNEPKAQERYIKFLSSGGSNYPLEILKLAGVDITTDKPYKDAFKYFEDKLQILEKDY